MTETMGTAYPEAAGAKPGMTQNARLTSTELASLWSQYLSDGMVACVLQHFLHVVEDTETGPVIEYALSLATRHIQRIKEIFAMEKVAVPIGFTGCDTNEKAPRLFADDYFLYYMLTMARMALGRYGFTLSTTARSDVRDFLNESLVSAAELYNRVCDTLLSKGLFIRPPHISMPQSVSFVKHENYLGNLFRGKRALNAIEITSIYFNSQNNSYGKSLLMGFGQVAQTAELRKYFLRGNAIAKKHIEVFNKILVENDLPTPLSWDTEVMDTTTAPFSDKLMLYHIVYMVTQTVGNYGLSLGTIIRMDIVPSFERLIAELLKYAEDGSNLLIKNGWMEEPPQADDHEAIAKRIKH